MSEQHAQERKRANRSITLPLIFMVVALPIALWLSALLLQFVSRLGNWCLAVLVIDLLLAAGFGVVELLRRRWARALVCWMAFPAIMLVQYVEPNTGSWVSAVGFRGLLLADTGYLSRCRVVGFVESGKDQRFGLCGSIPDWGLDWMIVYDTTGQFVLPVGRRGPTWREAVSKLSWSSTLAESEKDRGHITGDFYYVALGSGD